MSCESSCPLVLQCRRDVEESQHKIPAIRQRMAEEAANSALERANIEIFNEILDAAKDDPVFRLIARRSGADHRLDDIRSEIESSLAGSEESGVTLTGHLDRQIELHQQRINHSTAWGERAQATCKGDGPKIRKRWWIVGHQVMVCQSPAGRNLFWEIPNS